MMQVRSALRRFLSTELPNFIPDDSWSELSREDDHESAGVCNDGDGEVEETRTRPQHGETLPPPAVTFVPVAPPSHPPALTHHITVPPLAPPLHTGCWGPPAAASGARFADRPAPPFAPPPTHHVTVPTAAPVPTHTTECATSVGLLQWRQVCIDEALLTTGLLSAFYI